MSRGLTIHGAKKMGTNFYALHDPITSIKLESNGAHTKITIWINHANAGTLTIRNNEVGGFCLALRGEQVGKRTAGQDSATKFTFYPGKNLLGTTQHISEYVDLYELRDLRT